MKRKYKTIILLMILIVCIGIVSHDVYLIVLQPWITHETVGWTWFGFITFVIALLSSIKIIDYLNCKFTKTYD